jgi:hypothetical protein
VTLRVSQQGALRMQQHIEILHKVVFVQDKKTPPDEQ